MTSIVVLLAVLAGLSVWWLSGQGLTAKPWLQEGVIDVGPGMRSSQIPAAKMGLGIFLAVAASLFALFISAYSMRMGMADWRPLPLPKLLGANTFALVLSSAALQGAVIAGRRGDVDALRIGLLAGGVFALAFLGGQILAWHQLAVAGYGLAGNPANTFFYLFTGVHGLHVLGGLVALGRAGGRAWGHQQGNAAKVHLSVELCALYWHFLLLVWLVLLGLLTGWAGDFLVVCRQLLT